MEGRFCEKSHDSSHEAIVMITMILIVLDNKWYPGNQSNGNWEDKTILLIAQWYPVLSILGLLFLSSNCQYLFTISNIINSYLLLFCTLHFVDFISYSYAPLIYVTTLGSWNCDSKTEEKICHIKFICSQNMEIIIDNTKLRGKLIWYIIVAL